MLLAAPLPLRGSLSSKVDCGWVVLTGQNPGRQVSFMHFQCNEHLGEGYWLRPNKNPGVLHGTKPTTLNGRYRASLWDRIKHSTLRTELNECLTLVDKHHLPKLNLEWLPLHYTLEVGQCVNLLASSLGRKYTLYGGVRSHHVDRIQESVVLASPSLYAPLNSIRPSGLQHSVQNGPDI